MNTSRTSATTWCRSPRIPRRANRRSPGSYYRTTARKSPRTRTAAGRSTRFKAIESLVNSGAELLLYSVNNITSGTDSQGEVTVRLSKTGRIVNGQGADTDIVVASAKAYINALNKLHSKLERLNPQV